MDSVSMHIIAHIETDFASKFGIPRQSGLADTRARVVFTPAYRNADALRGIEGFSHLWLIWYFSEADRDGWSPTVRPPRLGGEKRMGVFATRSPFRPNAIGLSSVKLIGVEKTADKGTVLIVSGADLMDGTPIFDIKPYLPLSDLHVDATGGFAQEVEGHALQVEFPEELLNKIPQEKRQGLMDVLREDPRPSYQNDPERRYGFGFAGFEVGFKVNGMILTVCDVNPIEN